MKIAGTWRHILLVAGIVLGLGPAGSAAALDPDAKQPYHLRVVLVMPDHPLLTPAFHHQLAHEIRASLQAALGEMGLVEVFDGHELSAPPASAEGDRRRDSLARTLALLRAVEARGLERALDDWHEISTVKTHFILVNYQDDAYQIQARQFDGSTGLASPLVRRVKTADREFVARAALLLIDRDFGLVGTIDSGSPGPTVPVTFRGGELGVSLQPWVKKGDVFAVSRIEQAGGGQQRGTRIDWTLLQVQDEPREGKCSCRLWNRYKDPLAGGPAVAGFRCMKLGATTAPLRLRLIDETTGAPLASLRVNVSTNDFEARGAEEGSTGADGIWQTHKDYPQLALVQVSSGGTQRARIPVAILGESVVVCRLPTNPSMEARGQLDLMRSRIIEQIGDSQAKVGELTQEVNELNKKNAHEDALQRVDFGQRALQRDLDAYAVQMGQLQQAAQSLGGQSGFGLDEVEHQLKELRASNEQLKTYRAELREIVQKEKDPKWVQWREMLSRAKLLRDQAEFDQAIRLYQQVLEAGGDRAELRPYATQLQSLIAAWTPKNEEHGVAQRFFVETWPRLDTPEKLKDKLPQAEQMLQILRTNQDRLTPLVLLKANIAHALKLRKRLDELLTALNQDNQNELKLVREVSQGLEHLTKEATASVDAGKKPMK